jgi:hypothetical protein
MDMVEGDKFVIRSVEQFPATQFKQGTKSHQRNLHTKTVDFDKSVNSCSEPQNAIAYVPAPSLPQIKPRHSETTPI